MDGKICTKCGQHASMCEYTFPGTRPASVCRTCRNVGKVEYRKRRGAISREDRSMCALAKRIALRQAHSVESAQRMLRVSSKASFPLEYYTWGSMKARCNRATHPKYPRYGGRGIRVCDRWAHSFDAFLSDVGPKPAQGLSIDRINNDGNYEPGNVRWADDVTQQNNKSRTLAHFDSIRRVR